MLRIQATRRNHGGGAPAILLVDHSLILDLGVDFLLGGAGVAQGANALGGQQRNHAQEDFRRHQGIAQRSRGGPSP